MILKPNETISYSQNLERKEKYKNISLKLNELKNIIKGRQQNDENKTKIFEYIIYPKLISIDELKNKIYNIFNVKNNDKLFSFLIEEIKILFQKNAPNSPEEEEELRSSFYKILENLNCFISHSLIYYINKNKKKNEPLEFFQKWVIKDNIVTKSLLSSYINIFNLESLLIDFYCINREECKFYSNINFLNLISILKLQNIYKYNNFITEGDSKSIEKTDIFYYLYSTYNSNLKEIDELTTYIISINSNFLPSTIVKKILDDKDIANKIDNHFKNLLIEKIMINYSLQNDIKVSEINEFICYFSIITDNINIIPKTYNVSWEKLNIILKYYLSNKEYDKSISLLNSIKDINIINQIIDTNLINNLSINIPLNKIKLISNIVKNNKPLVNYLLKNNSKKDSIKLIKFLKLNQNEYDSSYDDIFIINFFQYKICSCIENQFDILVDYGLINENTYNKLISKLMKKTYEIIPNKNYNNYNLINKNYLPLNEDDEQELNNINNLKINFKKNIKLNNNILTEEDKERIIILFKLANKKNYELSFQNENLFNQIFGDLFFYNYINLKIDKYIPEDKFGPHNSSCLSIEKMKVQFVDNYQLFFSNYYLNFKESRYIGIDSEWRHQILPNIKENASILQLANYSEKKVMIIDLLKLKDDKSFLDLFENLSNKTFIGYSFNKSDIEQFNIRLQNFFKKVEIIDLIDIYQHKYLEKAPSLKDMCKKNFRKGIMQI